MFLVINILDKRGLTGFQGRALPTRSQPFILQTAMRLQCKCPRSLRRRIGNSWLARDHQAFAGSGTWLEDSPGPLLSGAVSSWCGACPAPLPDTPPTETPSPPFRLYNGVQGRREPASLSGPQMTRREHSRCAQAVFHLEPARAGLRTGVSPAQPTRTPCARTQPPAKTPASNRSRSNSSKQKCNSCCPP